MTGSRSSSGLCAGVRVEHRDLGGLDRVADRDPRHEPVALGLGQGVGALHLDRVLGRDHHERRVELVRRAVDGDLPLLHALQQRGLGLGRGPVDLVADHDVGEDAARAELELPGVLVEDRDAGDVGGQQVGGELDAPHRAVDAMRASALPASSCRRPGTSSMSRWPSASSTTSASRTTSGLPSMTGSMLSPDPPSPRASGLQVGAAAGPRHLRASAVRATRRASDLRATSPYPCRPLARRQCTRRWSPAPSPQHRHRRLDPSTRPPLRSADRGDPRVARGPRGDSASQRRWPCRNVVDGGGKWSRVERKWRKPSTQDEQRSGGARCSSGTYTPKLDDKGRLFLPAKFRDQLAEGLVVTRGQERCLTCGPRPTSRRSRAAREAPVTQAPATTSGCSSPVPTQDARQAGPHHDPACCASTPRSAGRAW